MTKEEFIERTGIIPTDEQYKQIEDMYCNAGNMDKDDFCEDYKNHGDSKLLAFFYKNACDNKDLMGYMLDRRDEMIDLLLAKSVEYNDAEMMNKAIEVVGHAAVIKRKVTLNLNLWPTDKKYIRENLV